MRNIHDKHFEDLLNQRAPERYAYFIRQVADWEEVWTLRTAVGFCLMANDDVRELVPVWPHKRFAEACAVAEFAGAEAVPISLEQWIQRWLPGMQEDGRGVAVFPTPGGQGAIVEPNQMLTDLESECEQYE